MRYPAEMLVVALDIDSRNELVDLVQAVFPYVRAFKLGPEVILNFGLDEVLDILSWYGAQAFVDLKFNDVPNTVARAVKALAKRETVRFFTVHAAAGLEALQAAVEMAGPHQQVIAVTVLTSLDDYEASDIFQMRTGLKVLDFTRQALAVGVHGIVCSAHDLEVLKNHPFDRSFIKVVAGIRPAWAVPGDQRRWATPAEAVRLGADMLVVGRPILCPPEGMQPEDAAQAILDEIDKAWSSLTGVEGY